MALRRFRIRALVRILESHGNGLGYFHQHRNLSDGTRPPTVSIVGSGPAGFGITQYLLKNHDTLEVNMIEKCPIPYGLIRYGVSPDHQDVKNCIHGYEKLAENDRFSFYGGLEVGKNLTLEEIAQFSDSIVLCAGAQKRLKLGVEGADLKNIFSANEFVGWYNGTQEHCNVEPDLSGNTAVIIGVGNVALDCARMLLKPWNSLSETDITESSLEALKTSNIKNVILLGRRGPLQMACTRRELSEITELEGVRIQTDQECFTDEVMKALEVKNLKLRKTQRLVKYLIDSTEHGNDDDSTRPKSFTVKLLSAPVKFNGDNGEVDSIIVQKNLMSGEDSFNPAITKTNKTEELKCDLVISAIGYGNELLDPTIPSSNGRIQAVRGRVEHSLPLYACGWCKTGPKGVLGDTLNDCLVTGKTLLKDLNSRDLKEAAVARSIEDVLEEKKATYFSWKNWSDIDEHEVEVGKKLGKVREKVVLYDEMAKIAFS